VITTDQVARKFSQEHLLAYDEQNIDAAKKLENHSINFSLRQKFQLTPFRLFIAVGCIYRTKARLSDHQLQIFLLNEVIDLLD
jgi:hypothetical protein